MIPHMANSILVGNLLRINLQPKIRIFLENVDFHKQPNTFALRGSKVGNKK